MLRSSQPTSQPAGSDPWWRQLQPPAVARAAGRITAAAALVMVLQLLDPASSAFGSLANSLRMLALLVAIVLVGMGADTAYLIPWALLPHAIHIHPVLSLLPISPPQPKSRLNLT